MTTCRGVKTVSAPLLLPCFRDNDQGQHFSCEIRSVWFVVPRFPALGAPEPTHDSDAATLMRSRIGVDMG